MWLVNGSPVERTAIHNSWGLYDTATEKIKMILEKHIIQDVDVSLKTSVPFFPADGWWI